MELADPVAVELAGEQDRVLRSLEERLRLSLDLRGNRLTLSGGEREVSSAAAVIEELAGLVNAGRGLGPAAVEAVASAVEREQPVRGILDDVIWRNRQAVVTPRTVGQKAYCDAIRKHTITFGIGPAA